MAFKLSELFVEIQGQDAPFTSMIAKFKTQAIATADSIGHSMGDKIVSGITSRFGLVGKLFDVIKGKLGMTDADIIDMAVQKGLESLPELTTKLRALAEDTFPGLEKSILSYADSFLQAFGSDSIGWIDDIDSAIVGLRETFTETGEIIKESWDLLLGIGWAKWRTFGENIGEVIGTMAANAVQVGEYIANNWTKLLTDAANAIVIAFKNVGNYLGELAYAIFEFLKDPSKGFEAPEWKGLLDGFKATAEKLPEMLAVQFRDAEPEIAKLMEEMGDRARKRKEAKPPEEAKAAAAAAFGNVGEKFKPESFGAAEFYAKLRQSTFSTEKDKVVMDQLKEAKKANEHLKKIADKDAAAKMI